MRKHQQEQILELLKLIKQARPSGQYEDCQEATLSICKFAAWQRRADA